MPSRCAIWARVSTEERELRQQRIDLLGLAAPKRSVHATVDLDAELDSVMAELVQAYKQRDAERERELADLRAQLARAQAPGPPPLTVLAGKAAQAGEIMILARPVAPP